MACGIITVVIVLSLYLSADPWLNIKPPMISDPNFVQDCACVIHGDYYDWTYVERLYAGICRNLSYPVRMHVFTEPHRAVPAPFIRHDLKLWPGIAGRKRAWWYKMQMFNPKHIPGRVLYFDLDVVIIRNIDWILSLQPRYFWSVLDFRYLWTRGWNGINSSVMFWETERFRHVWKAFQQQDLDTVVLRYAGDQDYLSAVIDQRERQYLDREVVQSWRWEISEGGLDFRRRVPNMPGHGAQVTDKTGIIVFHGRPKPHDVTDPVIVDNWRI